jgi:hypothetical protein
VSGGTRPLGVNDKDIVVGYYTDIKGAAHAFMEIGGTYTTIDDPVAVADGGITTPGGVNDLGWIVGHY